MATSARPVAPSKRRGEGQGRTAPRVFETTRVDALRPVFVRRHTIRHAVPQVHPGLARPHVRRVEEHVQVFGVVGLRQMARLLCACF